MNSKLVNVLDILAKGRIKLVESYRKRDSNRYHYFFQYYSSPGALEIVSCLLNHQWIDGQLYEGMEEYKNGNLSKESYSLLIKTVQHFSVFKTNEMPFEGYSELLNIKIKGLQELLRMNENASQKLKSIEFNLNRDKFLFEGELKKYENQI